jgi:hypothetical protein
MLGCVIINILSVSIAAILQDSPRRLADSTLNTPPAELYCPENVSFILAFSVKGVQAMNVLGPFLTDSCRTALRPRKLSSF